jgi:hAT family C-terminal dimerisation region
MQLQQMYIIPLSEIMIRSSESFVFLIISTLTILLARNVLCIPVTSASSEQAFSAAGYTLFQNVRRTRWDPETVDSLLFVRSL